jgi:polyadenylation factor subunit 2
VIVINFYIGVQWHPRIEDMLASGGSDGSIKFWRMGYENSVGDIDFAHESPVWSLDWHPLGHIIVSGSNDHTTRFWTRARPGESMGPQDAKFHSTVVKDEFAHVDWNDGVKATTDIKDSNGDVKSSAFQLPGLGNISHEPVNKNSFTSKLFNPNAVSNQPTLLPHQQHHNNQGGNYPPRPMGGLPPLPPPPFNRHHGPPPPHGQFNTPNYPPRPPHHQNGHQNHQNGHQNHQNGHQGHQGHQNHQNHQNGHQNRHRY